MTTLAVAEKNEVTTTALAQTKDAVASLAYICELNIDTPEAFRTAVGMVAAVKAKHKEVDDKRREYVERLSELVDDFNAEFKPGLDALAEAEKTLKAKISTWVFAMSHKHQEAIREAAAAAEAGDHVKADELIAGAEVFETPKVKGCSVSELWTGEVVNPDEIPREYLVPDAKTLRALTKAKKADPKIPGWRAYAKPSVTITVSKVRT